MPRFQCQCGFVAEKSVRIWSCSARITAANSDYTAMPWIFWRIERAANNGVSAVQLSKWTANRWHNRRDPWTPDRSVIRRLIGSCTLFLFLAHSGLAAHSSQPAQSRIKGGMFWCCPGRYTTGREPAVGICWKMARYCCSRLRRCGCTWVCPQRRQCSVTGHRQSLSSR